MAGMEQGMGGAPMGGAPMGPPPMGGDPNAMGGGADPAMQQIEGMLAEYSQSKDPGIAVQICDMLVSASGMDQAGAPPMGADPMAGGGAPPMGGDPMAGGAPMGRYGMSMPAVNAYGGGGKINYRKITK